MRYDVYGNDVEIANKIESNGVEGSITVSERTMELLMKAYPNSFVFKFHKEVHLQSLNQTVKSYRIFDVRNKEFIIND